MIDPRWNEVMRRRGWGTWPTVRFVEFVMRHYAQSAPRHKIRFLELGCGAGAQLRFLARAGFDTWGMDGSSEAIGLAIDLLSRETFGGRYWEERLMKFDLTQLGSREAAMFLPNNPHYDCIFDVCALQHLEPTEAAATVQAAVTMLKPGGRFFSMWAMKVPDNLSDDVPAPNVLTSEMMPFVFAGLGLSIGAESVRYPDGGTSDHWIIEGEKRDGG